MFKKFFLLLTAYELFITSEAIKCYVCVSAGGSSLTDFKCPIPFDINAGSVSVDDCRVCTTMTMNLNQTNTAFRFCSNGEYAKGSHYFTNISMKFSGQNSPLNFTIRTQVIADNCFRDLCNSSEYLKLNYHKSMYSQTDNNLKSLYTTVFAQKFSPDGNHLAACDNFGTLFLYKLSSVLSADNIEKQKLPYLKFKSHNCSLYTLESTSELLLCSPLNELVAYRWRDLTHSKDSTRPFFSIKMPRNNDCFNINSNIETNSLVCDSKNDPKKVYAGCGNGEIFIYDLESTKIISKFTAHRDCIYQVLLKNNNNELISTSEDGEVKIWDLRSNQNCVSIKPHESSECSRPNLGKFITCAAVDDDNWLICGGGPRLAMWHLRSLKPMGIPEFTDQLFVPNVCKIHSNQIITGGNTNSLFIHDFENKLKTEIKTSSNCIYDISINTSSKSNRIVSIAGNGTSIDVCSSNLTYKALTLNF
ncbi:unnamed protein product [Brachionus calyciflorus]|uniref:Uncharacterized protein n=1 Tax=Brachionus calyciflorus TaxID=104777 RepID=A0A813VVM3_9BILA|nr:unnamed protein product [Brachionus calyciflorus]